MNKTGIMSGDRKRQAIFSDVKKMIIIVLSVIIGMPLFAQVKWHSIEEANSAKIGERLYFVDFYTSWCGYCKKMDRNTFADSTVAKILNKYYYPVKFDAESNKEVKWFGQNYKSVYSGRSRIHEFAKGISGFPTFRLYRSNGTVFQDIPGYYPPKEFVVVLWYFANGDYQRYSFEMYQKIFDTKIRPEMEKQLNR